MTELPQLREALRDTAERRYGARRRTPRLLVPAVCVAVLLVLGVLAASASDRGGVPPAADERVATPTPTPEAVTLADVQRQLEQVYAVFRRPARAGDDPQLGRAWGANEYDQAHARRVGGDGPHSAWLVPALIRRAPFLAPSEQTRPEPRGRPGLGRFDPGAAVSRPMWGRTRVHKGGRCIPSAARWGRVGRAPPAAWRPAPRPRRRQRDLLQVKGLLEFSWRAATARTIGSARRSDRHKPAARANLGSEVVVERRSPVPLSKRAAQLIAAGAVLLAFPRGARQASRPRSPHRARPRSPGPGQSPQRRLSAPRSRPPRPRRCRAPWLKPAPTPRHWRRRGADARRADLDLRRAADDPVLLVLRLARDVPERPLLRPGAPDPHGGAHGSAGASPRGRGACAGFRRRSPPASSSRTR